MGFAVWILVTIATIPVGHGLLHSGLGSHDEMRLVENLLHGYNSLIRPVGNLTQTVNVKFGLAMIQLINVDEKNQIMKSNVWLRMLWNDYQLQWDPSEYGGINVIRILSHKVWKPDIVLFNNADGRYEVSYKPNVVIFSIGDVMWIPPAIYKSSCTINVLYFPFDEQKCFMKFGSWTFNGDQVVLDWYEGHEKVDLSDYVNSGTWDIIASPGVYNRTWDNIEGHHKAQITFTLRIRRKTLFYTVNLIIPCVLISFLSVCVFYLPADAGEKMTMCISILLALVVFLLLVSKILPPNSNTIPLIAKYLLFTFIMNIITIVITVVIINWNFKTPRTNTMPKWLRTVFLNYLPRLLLMKRPQKHLRRCERAGINSSSKITWQKEFSRTFQNISTFHKPSNSPVNKPGDERDDTGDEIQLADRVCMIKRNKQRFVRRCLSSEHLEFHTAPRHQSSANPAFGSTFPEGSIDASSIYHDENIDTPSASFYRRPRPVRIQQHLSLQEAQTSVQSKSLGRKSFDWKRTDNKHSASTDDLLLIFNPSSTQQNFASNRSSVNPAFQPRFCRQLDEFRKLKAEEFSGKFSRGRRARDSSFEVEELQTPQEHGEPFEESPEFITIPSNTPTYTHYHHHHHHQYPHDIQSEQRFGFHSQKSCLKRRILPSGNSCGVMSPEAAKAIDAVRFIAAHLKNEDEYNEILDDWRYIASVIDRLQLIIFLLVTVVGTAAILFNAPHIFEFVDQDEIKRRIIESSDGTLN